MNAKNFLLKKIEEKFNLNDDFKILDLGCGQARNFIYLLSKYPKLKYVGVEPSKSEVEKAQELLKDFSNAKVINSTAYDVSVDNDFDLSVSLSVLEHVKYKDKFLKKGADSLKKNGHFICFYDLGHYLYPSCIKERVQLFLSKYFFKIIPEPKFVGGVDKNKVFEILKNFGLDVEKITYHNSFKSRKLFKLLLKNKKNLDIDMEKCIFDYFKWEYDASRFVDELLVKEQNLFFGSVCFWAIKK